MVGGATARCPAQGPRIDVRIRDDAPRDAVLFVPTRKTIERAVHEGRNPDRYFGMITEIKL
jgi:hypothetical protein